MDVMTLIVALVAGGAIGAGLGYTLKRRSMTDQRRLAEETAAETRANADAEKKATDAGATYVGGRPTSPKSFYECKYRDPDGVIFDLTHNGWVGAVKDVVPENNSDVNGVNASPTGRSQ